MVLMLASLRDEDQVLALAQTKTEWRHYGNKQKDLRTKNLTGQPLARLKPLPG